MKSPKTLLAICVAVIGYVVLHTALTGGFDSDAFEQRAAAREARAAAAQAAQEAAAKRPATADDCITGWDGYVLSVREWTRRRLLDPDSFDHDTTRIRDNGDGTALVLMKFRGRNAFGGVVPNIAMATIRNEDCAITSAQIVG